jgi:two-component system response regulator FlrC
VPVILLTGHASVDTAVEAMRLGAHDYVLKPVQQDAVLAVVVQALQSRKIGKVAKSLSNARQKSGMKKEKPIIGNSESLRKVMIRAKTVASSKATILVSGESGTGKEVFARYIHSESDRAGGPFVALNCAALPEGLLESELFGHEKGAFTGAISAKKGKFELASRGTILLDEIGEVPLHLQAKLLRVLQEEEVDRLGGSEPISVDVHVVASTNRNLTEMVEEGTFRQDLFYRLNVIPLVLPPLRDRKTDIPILAQYFLEKFSKTYGREMKAFSDPVKREFLANNWTGNVREMENLVERAVLLCQTEIYQLEDFWDDLAENNEAEPDPASVVWQTPPSRESPSSSPVQIHAEDGSLVSLKNVERQMILHALEKTDNNRTHAAKMLGISVRTLRNKLHEYRNSGLVV